MKAHRPFASRPLAIQILLWVSLVGYVGIATLLYVESSLPGETSGERSSKFGEVVAKTINDVAPDQASLSNASQIKFLEEPKETLSLGEEYQLSASALPEGTSYPSLTYASSDAEVASISQRGKILAKKEGHAEITVSLTHDPSQTVTYSLQVKKKKLTSLSLSLSPATKDGSLTFSSGTYWVNQGEDYVLTPSFQPEGTSDSILYYCSSSAIVLDEQHGLFHVSSTDVNDFIFRANSNTFSATIKAHIVPVASSVDKAPSSFSLKNGEETLSQDSPYFVGDVLTLSPDYGEEVSSQSFVSYSTLTPDLISIQGNKITFLDAGQAVLVAKEHLSGLTKQIPLTVHHHYAKLSMPSSSPMENNQYVLENSEPVRMDFASEAGDYEAYSLSSSDPSILQAGQDGYLMPVARGEVTLTLTQDDGFTPKQETSFSILVGKKPLIDVTEPNYDRNIRKGIGHFGAFFALGFFSTFFYLVAYRGKMWAWSIPLNFLSGFSTAGFTEFIELFTPGRSGLWSDVWLDFSGFCLCAVLESLIILLVFLISSKKAKKKKQESSQSKEK